MRCPNCGNENPEDYVFCDECGARLQPLADTGQGESAPVGMDGGVAAAGGGMGEAAPDDGGAMPSWQPSDDAGIGGAMMGAADDTGAGGQPQDAASAEDAGPQPGWSYSGPPMDDTAATGITGMDDSSGGMGESVPATEDTIAADAGAEEMSAGADAEADADAAAMPGVVPMVGDYSDAEETSIAAGGAGMAGASSDEWSTAAMSYLEEAQRALDNLRQHLSSASGSTAAGAAGEAGMAGAAAGGATGYDALPPPGQSMETDGVTYGPDEVDEARMGMAGAAGMVYGASAAPDLADMPGASTLEPEAESGSLAGAAAVGAAAGLAAGAGAETGMGAGPAMAGGMAAAQEAPAESAEPVMARLVVIATGAEMPLPDQEEITVGREDPSSGIFPDVDLTPYGGEDGGVSRRHAKLLRIDNEFFVEDLQSTNYTKLDGQRLPSHVRERLEDGARLDFGRVATIFRRS